MILIRLFFLIITFCTLLVVALGAFLWLKIRFQLMNPLTRPSEPLYHPTDENVIEGDYKVLEETKK